MNVMPIDYALRKGADEIIAVDLNQDPQHPNFIERPHINYILPLIDTGFILNFDHVVGAVSRYHTLNYRRREFVLVDHSARNQAINNVEEAHINAIIDHHHIGNIETTYPIFYRNQICGCTCTIISNLYQENGLLPDKDMITSAIIVLALLMLSFNLFADGLRDAFDPKMKRM